jgi:hypothetical protein
VGLALLPGCAFLIMKFNFNEGLGCYASQVSQSGETWPGGSGETVALEQLSCVCLPGGPVKLNDWSAHRLKFTEPAAFPQ